MEILTNKYQTPITDELLSQYPEEVVEQFLDCVNNIEFIKNLISPNRKYAKDLPRDEEGKIIIDLENPHIVENMDYFRQAALHYLKHGCYTFLKPNSNPHSEYRKFWDEEIRRCREGFVRKSDGEWVTGFCYWFLNYVPMMVNVAISATTAVRQESFPYFFEGIYWRFHYLYRARKVGKHAIELAKRGCGKSYSLAAIMSHNLILGENSLSTKGVVTVLTAYQKEFLKGDKDGTLSKFTPTINFVWANTPFPRLTLKNSPEEMSWMMGYKDDSNIERGSRNKALAVSAKDDSEKLRGKRGWILFEEMGSFKGLLTLYDVTRRSVEDGGLAFACMYLVGTAADSESDFSSAKTLLYNPRGYRILYNRNVWDRPKQGKADFGFFFPAYINRAGCYNKDGVSDVVKALFEILMARYEAKYSADPKSVIRVIAEDPITPAEAIVKVKSAYFPVAALGERISQLDQDPNAYSDVYVGDLVLRDGKVTFKLTEDIPIHTYGVENTTQGALEIFEMPQKDNNGNVYTGRYIIGHDPVDNDQAESSSLSSTFVLDLLTDRIVAEFTGRKPFANDNFEMVRLLCMFYNAKCLYESNKKGLYSYFASKNCTHYLADTPEYLRDKQLVKYSNFGSNQKGVNASANINNFANGLLRDWLSAEVPMLVKNEDGIEVETSVPRLYTIRNRALLDECRSFTPELNVDRIRAMGMVMIYREEKIVLYQGNLKNAATSTDVNYLGNDKFFTNNYDKRRLRRQ